MSRFVISCGGTGGHLSPGIALAEELIRWGHEVLLLVTEKEVDSRLMEKYQGLTCQAIPSASLGFSPGKLYRFVVNNLRGYFLAKRILTGKQTDAVVSFGGFLSLPVLSAARRVRSLIVLHEANRIPGKATRTFRKAASRIYLPRGVELRGISAEVVRDYGFPVRREFKRISRDEARRMLGMPKEGKLLTILGGSQGAQALNDWARDHFDQLSRKGINLYCVAGMGPGREGFFERELEGGRRFKARFVSFTDQMAAVISASDLIVSRAGAGTIAELMRCRVPAILVPYPHAADNHQEANARFFEQQGGGLTISQASLGQLLDEVEELMFNDWLLAQFQKNLGRMDDPLVLERTVKDLEALIALSGAGSHIVEDRLGAGGPEMR